MKSTVIVVKTVKLDDKVIRQGTKAVVEKVGFAGLFARVGPELFYFFNEEIRREG